MSTVSIAWAPAPPAKAASRIDRLLDAVLCWFDATLVEQAAGELARECRDAVWQHVHQRTRGMGYSQARGYVRAAAPAFLEREINVVLSRRRAGAFLRPHVMARALEQVADMVAEDVSRTKTRESALSKAA